MELVSCAVGFIQMRDSGVPYGHHDNIRRYLVSFDCDTSQTSQRYERVKEIPRVKKPIV